MAAAVRLLLFQELAFIARDLVFSKKTMAIQLEARVGETACCRGPSNGWERPRAWGVRRLTLQPGGTDGSPLHGGACHGQMGTVSGPPRRHDRGGATQLFLRLMGSDDTPHLEMPRGVGVRRLTL